MKVTQIRFFGDHRQYAHMNWQDSNCPNNLTSEDLYTGDFLLNYPYICSIRISGLPGTGFILDNKQPSVIGSSGVYELDNLNRTITLKFNKNSLKDIDTNPDGYLIIDIVYMED